MLIVDIMAIRNRMDLGTRIPIRNHILILMDVNMDTAILLGRTVSHHWHLSQPLQRHRQHTPPSSLPTRQVHLSIDPFPTNHTIPHITHRIIPMGIISSSTSNIISILLTSASRIVPTTTMVLVNQGRATDP